MAKEIFIYGPIGIDWWTGEGNTAKGLIRDLAAVPEGEEVHIRINSPGGDLVEGIAMYNAIVSHPGKTVTINDGFAASMGFILLQAGDVRKGYKNSTGLVHNCSGMAWGNARDLRSTAELLDKFDDGLMASIAQKADTTTDELKKKWFDYVDHSLNAQEMKDAGLIDELIDINIKGVPENVSSLSRQEMFAAYARIKNPEENKGFMARFISEIKAAWKEQFPTTQTNSTNTEDDMKVTILKEHSAVAQVLGITFADNEASREVEISAEQIAEIDAAIAEEVRLSSEAINAAALVQADLDKANEEILKLKKVAAKSVSPKSNGEKVDDPEAALGLEDPLQQEAANAFRPRKS